MGKCTACKGVILDYLGDTICYNCEREILKMNRCNICKDELSEDETIITCDKCAYSELEIENIRIAHQCQCSICSGDE